jgi:recombination protein RecA
VRIEVRRGKNITKGDMNIGHELFMKVVKNKQAPPFRSGHTTLIYGRGVPKGIAVLDMALDFEIIKRKGSWISYKGENLGQGKETVSQYLESHPELMEEVTKEVLAAVSEGINITHVAAPSDPDAETEEHSTEEIEMDESVLELDED